MSTYISYLTDTSTLTDIAQFNRCRDFIYKVMKGSKEFIILKVRLHRNTQMVSPL